MSKRKLYKLEIYSFNPAKASETREFEARNLAEAAEIKNMLLNGRPYYSLTEITTVVRPK